MHCTPSENSARESGCVIADAWVRRRLRVRSGVARGEGGSRPGTQTRGAPMAIRYSTFQFFFIKIINGPCRRAQGGHGAMASPLALALLWIPIRIVKISDTGVFFFDKKTSLK